MPAFRTAHKSLIFLKVHLVNQGRVFVDTHLMRFLAYDLYYLVFATGALYLPELIGQNCHGYHTCNVSYFSNRKPSFNPRASE